MDMLVFQRTRFTAGWLPMLLAGAFVAAAQPASTSQPSPASGTAIASHSNVSSIVQPALSQVQSSVSSLNIARWKAPGEVRGAAQQNTASIQRDLSDTLPALLTQADAAPGAVSPSFTVYRNIEALYDVLLRVYETASLAAPQNEADGLGSALQRLESARRQLGDTIFSDSKEHEAQVVQLQSALKAANEAAARAQAPPPKTAVIDDGPAATPAARKKKKPAPKPPANSSGSSQSPPSQTP